MAMSEFKKLLKKHSYLNRFQVFQNLMQFRVREILLVSSLYDSFILEEEGQLYEMILSQYQTLNLSQAPNITRVSVGSEAIRMAKDLRRFDLIVTTPNLSDMTAVEFAQKMARTKLGIPVVLLTYDTQELTDLAAHYDISIFEKVFIWQGDHRILISIIKYIEDRKNVAYDAGVGGVQVILVIEDNIYFYSSFLPLIYLELFRHSHSLISEAINISHKILRMRARPKIILCSTYEEAWDYYKKYEDCILGVISDIEFPCDHQLDEKAGIRFAREVKRSHFDIPVLLQSDSPKFEKTARKLEVSFLIKTSPTLHKDLRRFMTQSLNFGDFVFRLPDGTEVGRAANLRTLEKQLHTIPDESLTYHGERNHFSNWLKARTEFWLAHQLRPQKVTDYKDVDSLRRNLIISLHDFRKAQYLGSISDFDAETFDTSSGFARIGSGSLGGKARGLGFANSLIASFKLADHFEDVRISVPPTVVLATDIFDRFIDDNDLRDFALKSEDDTALVKRFLKGLLPPETVEHLRDFLTLIRYPLAVRSSSQLEDSRYLPFAGIYATYMLPNNHRSLDVRLEELVSAIKRVYASTFSTHARSYLKSTPYRLEEERMAVIIQKLVGSRHGDRFYPGISGVVRSHNFYPLPPMKSRDGISSVSLGLGRTVVEGGSTIRFCPRYPQHLNQFSTVEDYIRYSQKDFYALKLEDPDDTGSHTREMKLHKYHLEEAEADGVLSYIASTYSPENDNITVGTGRDGIRLVTFAPILKNKLMPLPKILEIVMEMGSWGMNSPVEIEFAVDVVERPASPREFGFLQIRPLVQSHEIDESEFDDVATEQLICRSDQVLGNGTIDNIRDIVVIDKDRYDRSRSHEVAAEIRQFNQQLVAAGRPYLLIGVGRWGSADPWLGIPVKWDEISGARAIIETSFKDLKVELSQGTHFFQNITSFRVGYFTVKGDTSSCFVDWKWLGKQKGSGKNKFTRHLRFRKPLVVRMNGHTNQGVILKPAK